VSSPARLPLFPLPLVLFPGASLPLHVFEPRYRQLLADCRAGDGRFGIVVSGDAGAPGPGTVGCVAELRDVQSLPDGRANIVVEGAERFALARLAESTTPYLVGEVRPWEDAPEPDAADSVVALDAAVRAAFARVARAARTIADDTAPLPTLPDDPAALSFAVAAAVDFDLPTRQRLLVSRSVAERLRELDGTLTRAVSPIEARAAVHVGARSNGRGTH
jgi:Lon protease-like protein